MIVQSLSIAVPAGCPNNCKFCVSKMHEEDYANQIEKNLRFRDLYKKDYLARMAFARDNGCNVLMFTGNGEPLMNKRFMEEVADLNAKLSQPFRILELQTSGVTLDEETLRWLRNTIGVSTISLSVSCLDKQENAFYNETPAGMAVDIAALCDLIKKYDFNLRLSLNMTDFYNQENMSGGIEALFEKVKNLGADQVTFRRLYSSSRDTPQDKWVVTHAVENSFWPLLNSYIEKNGRELERLPYGAYRYAVGDISTVIDSDCMSRESKDEIKYLILRPNCKLYTQWDCRGSLLF